MNEIYNYFQYEFIKLNNIQLLFDILREEEIQQRLVNETIVSVLGIDRHTVSYDLNHLSWAEKAIPNGFFFKDFTFSLVANGYEIVFFHRDWKFLTETFHFSGDRLVVNEIVPRVAAFVDIPFEIVFYECFIEFVFGIYVIFGLLHEFEKFLGDRLGELVFEVLQGLGGFQGLCYEFTFFFVRGLYSKGVKNFGKNIKYSNKP